MYRPPPHDDPRPVQRASWGDIAIVTVLFVLGPLVVMFLISQPLFAGVVGIGVLSSYLVVRSAGTIGTPGEATTSNRTKAVDC